MYTWIALGPCSALPLQMQPRDCQSGVESCENNTTVRGWLNLEPGTAEKGRVVATCDGRPDSRASDVDCLLSMSLGNLIM